VGFNANCDGAIIYNDPVISRKDAIYKLSKVIFSCLFIRSFVGLFN
jgi:hypothetical protein